MGYWWLSIIAVTCTAQSMTNDSTDLGTDVSLPTTEAASYSSLMEHEQQFKLWYTAAISLSVLVVTSMLFVMTVLLCRIMKERKKKGNIYKTRSRQGSIRLQGSVYHIRSQEVANVHYRVKETGSTIPEATSSESSMAEVTIVNQEEGVDAIPSAGGSIEPETSLRSVEEDIQEAAEEESDSGGEAHVYDTPFVNISQQHLISNSQQNITNSMCDNSTREYFQNSLSESFSLDIQESQQDIETAAGNSVLDQPAVTITLTFEDESHVQDIPGFHDPELKGVDEESGGLCVTVPPNIYSSQILSTVTENQDDCQEETETCGTETAGMGIEIGSEIHTYMNIGTPNTSHNIVDNNPPPTQAGTSHGHLAATHPGSREVNNIMKSDQLTPRGLWEGNGKLNDSRSASTTQGGDVLIVEQDVVYDQPIVLHKKQPPDGAENDDNDVDLEGVDLRMLFDDPGYTKGMMKQSQSHALSAQEYTPQTDLQAANSLTHNIQMHSNKVWEDGAEPEMKTLSVQMGRVPVMKSSINSLSLLDYDDSELDELDPVIASCLRTPYLSDTDDEIAISEV